MLETGGGSIQVERCAGKVKASTGGGSIELGDIGGPAEMETGGGSIRLSSAKGPVRAETGGGSIELNGSAIGAGGDWGWRDRGQVCRVRTANSNDSELETSAGDITVYLAPNVNLERSRLDRSCQRPQHSLGFSRDQGHHGGRRLWPEDGYRGRQSERRRSGAEGANHDRRHLLSAGQASSALYGLGGEHAKLNSDNDDRAAASGCSDLRRDQSCVRSGQRLLRFLQRGFWRQFLSWAWIRAISLPTASALST